MSSTTWQLVLQKRESRNVLRDLNALQRQTLLQACFVSWKGLETQDPAFANDVQIQFHHLLRDQDHAIAQALAEFRRLGRLVTSCSRTDDICFYENLLAAGAEHLAPAQARELWKIIKRNLPKYKNRRLGIDPLRMMSLEDEWNPHFKELEAGCVITPDELMQGAQNCHPDGPCYDAPSRGDLPTLFEFERALRANKPGRATGYDPLPSALYHNHAAELAEHAFPLLLKVWIWGAEPIQYKGGPMALIPKRAQPLLCNTIEAFCCYLPWRKACTHFFGSASWHCCIADDYLDRLVALLNKKCSMAPRLFVFWDERLRLTNAVWVFSLWI